MTNSVNEENKSNESIARGDNLTPQTWDDFVARLRRDCEGGGVNDHYTADAIFIVQSRQLVYGIDLDYSDKKVLINDRCEWFSPKEYWDDLDEEDQTLLNLESMEEADCPFLDRGERDQWDLLGEMPEFTVTGWDDRWEYVSAHFTKDAAEAFIKRKKHDYPKGLRVYVDAQTHCWEYNAIKAAILDGRIGLKC